MGFELLKDAVDLLSRDGLDALLDRMFALLDEMPDEESVVEIIHDLKARDHVDSEYEIIKHGKKMWEATGGKLERLFLTRRAESQPVTADDVNSRSLPVKLRDGFARLFAPLL